MIITQSSGFKHWNTCRFIARGADFCPFTRVQENVAPTSNNLSWVVGFIIRLNFRNRGKVVSLSPLKILFIDYGNTESMQAENLRKCPEKWSMEPLVSYLINCLSIFGLFALIILSIQLVRKINVHCFRNGNTLFITDI